VEHARDHYEMFPLLELAGLDRCRYIEDVLYTYNLADSFEFSASSAQLREERAAVLDARMRAPKSRLSYL
jgi:hypothetical protein